MSDGEVFAVGLQDEDADIVVVGGPSPHPLARPLTGGVPVVKVPLSL